MAHLTHYNNLNIKELKYEKIYNLGIFITGAIFSACQKKVEPVDAFNVTVEYRNSGT